MEPDERAAETITAPWDMETVRHLNRFQGLPFVHPFTCGNTVHSRAPRLVAGPNGWACPDPREDGCEYRQNWAHAFMADPDRWPHGPNPWQETESGDLGCGSCGRLDCDPCRGAYLTKLTGAVSATSAQVLAGMRELARDLATAATWTSAVGPASATPPPAPAPVGERWCCNGNAEECALCDVGELPYPWICPGGHEDTPVNRRTVLVDATDRGKDALRAAMKRLRVHDAALKVAAANPALAAEPVAETEYCELPHETIAEEEACDRLREAAKRSRELISHPGQDEPLDPEAFRALVSSRLLRIALERTEREWICCDPVNPRHVVCVQGDATRNMLTALLTDDPEVFPPRSDFLDEAVRLTLGHADPEYRHNVLSTAEVRELYGKAVTRGLQTVVDWDGMDDLKPLKANVIHAIMAEVVTTRDRELARNRQRLLLADEAHREAAEDAREWQTELENARTRARLEERLKVLDEARDILKAECAHPIEAVAFNNPLVRLREAREKAQATLDSLPRD